jgi:hypothetical protein
LALPCDAGRIGEATACKSSAAPDISDAFFDSMTRFVMPDARRAACTGPLTISSPTVNDLDVYNAIRAELASGSARISLQ